MRLKGGKSRFVTAVAIVLTPASLCAAQAGVVPGHQKNVGSTAGGFSGMLDGVDHSGRGVIGLGDLDADGVEVLRVEAATRVGPGPLGAPEARDGWVLMAPATAPSPRRVPGAMAYDSARGVTVLFGGYDGALDDETWEWDGVNWTQRIVSPRPSPRVTIAMAYDSARSVTVLFGGVTAAGLDNQTWEWDGASWTLVSTSGPAPRQWHAMAYDRGRGVTVLFGGNLGGAPGGLPTADTWEWDGASWTLRGGPRPPARFGHALAYDAYNQRVILFGGRDPAIGLYNDTWALGAGGWTLVPMRTRPSPRQAHAMVGDFSSVVLFGGLLNSGRSDETWYAVGWYLRPTARSPSRRGTHGMAYDSARGQIVLFGGDDGSSILNDTWKLLDAICPCACDFAIFGSPVCDIIDFVVFAGLFSQGDPCACNMDTSTGPGVCDLIDFVAFAGEFAGGCP